MGCAPSSWTEVREAREGNHEVRGSWKRLKRENVMCSVFWVFVCFCAFVWVDNAAATEQT